MIFERLELQGFRSFAKRVVFDFAGREPGLYFLTGRNEAEPDLGPNGAGKSSLLEGLVWVLFGRTSRKLRAGAVHTWGTKGGTSALLIFTYGGSRYELSRTWKPNALTLDDELIEQEAFEERFRLDPTAFQQQVMIGQFSGMFLDLQPAAKLDLFTEALQLDVWLRAATIARDRASAAEKRVAELDVEIALLEGRATELGAQHEKMVERAEVHDETRAKERDALRADVADKEDSLRAHEYAIAKYDQEFEAADGAVGALVRKRDKLQAKRDKKVEVLNELREIAANFEGRMLSNSEELTKLDAVTDECPYCRQKVSAAHLKREVARVKADARALKDELESVEASRDEINEKIRLLDLELIDVRADLRGDQTRAEELRRDRDRASVLKASAERALTDARWRLEQHEKSTENPYAAMAEEAARKFAKVKRKAGAAKLSKESAEVEAAAARYWQRGFKEIRLMLVDRALREVEVESNNCLVALGLLDWELSFAVETETKSGSVVRGLAATVLSPYNDEAVPFECWSGGESQRLRLAATMGLVNVLLARSDMMCNVEFWDEPTQHLSAEGVEALLDCLAERAEQSRKQVWLVDHRSISYGGFRSVVTAVKDATGSRLEEV